MLELASHILDTKAGHFEPSRFKDEFEIELRKLVKRKAAGKPIEYAEPTEKPANVGNLMEALRQSVEGPRRSRPAPSRMRKKPPAKTRRRKSARARRRAA